MRLQNILQQLPQEALETLARQRISQVTDIRLPQSVLIDELAEALASVGYVSNCVTLKHPPSFAILHLLMNAPDYSLPTEYFFHKVREETDRMVALASRRPIFPKPKKYDFYLRMLAAAWEYDSDINPSEANMLRAIREELGISLMEHFVIEHHPDLHRFWNTEAAYETERSHLRNSGIVFAIEEQYVIPEEIVVLIRRAWGYELSDAQYRRLLDVLSNDDLKKILDKEGLNISGAASEKKDRILDNYVLPRAALDAVGIEGLRDAARSLGCRAGGVKEELIDNLIDWLDCDEDLKARAAQAAERQEEIQIAPEKRELSDEALIDLLRRLTNESLYDLLSRLPRQRKSGNKEQRIKLLLASPFSERTMLSKLTNEVLHELCKQIGINPYGIKDEKINRTVEAYKNFAPPSAGSYSGTLTLAGTSEKTDAIFISPLPLESQLRLLSCVRSEFNYLDNAEQIVVSYLMDFKSLSDPELDKLIQRFALPWYLPKAQMMELINKLKANGRDIVQVRALGDKNIYQIIP